MYGPNDLKIPTFSLFGMDRLGFLFCFVYSNIRVYSMGYSKVLFKHHLGERKRAYTMAGVEKV